MCAHLQSAVTVCLKYKVVSLSSISGCCGSGTVRAALVHGKSKPEVMLEEVTVYLIQLQANTSGIFRFSSVPT